jgi:nucleotide-binding universal stress UspA family protein
MYKHILIATDGSDLAAKALVQGLSLAKALAAQVTIVTVTEPWATKVTGEAAIAFPFSEYEKAMAANAAEILSKANAMATQAGVACSTLHCSSEIESQGIPSGVQIMIHTACWRRRPASLFSGPA